MPKNGVGRFPEVSLRRYYDAVRLFNNNKSIAEQIFQRVIKGIPADAETTAEDIRQFALLGLWSAALKYEPSKGSSFETYARVRIRGEVYDQIREFDLVGKNDRKKIWQLGKAQLELSLRLNRIPTNSELGEVLGLATEEVVALRETAVYASRDGWITIPHCMPNGEWHDFIPDQNIVHPGEISDLNTRIDQLKEALRALPGKLRKIITLYYFENWKLWEIAEKLKVTESRICQLMSQALDILRNRLKQSVVFQ